MQINAKPTAVNFCAVSDLTGSRQEVEVMRWNGCSDLCTVLHMINEREFGELAINNQITAAQQCYGNTLMERERGGGYHVS